ncbi:MAG: hypothetical protein ABIP42_16175 [Planctomycetota bacterium]
MNAAQPKGLSERVPGVAEPPSQLWSLGVGIGLGALGSLPAWIPGSDTFSLLAWLAWVAPASGVFLGAARVDPLRFGAVAPALWAVAMALLGASEERASLPSPAFGALAWSGLFFAGMGIGALARSAASACASVLLASALLVGLPSRAGLAGEPWSPRATSVLLDLSPFVFLGECSGVRDMAWHRSLYAAAGTDRFQRTPWNGPWAGGAAFASGLSFAWLAARWRRRSQDQRRVPNG